MTEAEDATRSLMAFRASRMTTLYLSKDHSPKQCLTWHHLSRLQVDGSCSYRVNVRIVLIFANPNPTRIINVSTFANSNPIYLLFVLDRSIQI